MDLPVYAGASASASSPLSVGKKRSANWTNDEELVLIAKAHERENSLFGKMQGCGGQGKISKVKENAWQSIADTLNSKFVNDKRTVAEIKKKYYNIKQRGKEKLDQIKRPKTGGGEPPIYTPAEDLFVSGMEGRPQIEGLQ